MIDLIIPYYNNIDGLKRTLSSIDYTVFRVTIIDDCSPTNFIYPPNVTVIYNEKNVGPGIGRQIGIENTKNPYLMFLDAGDILLSKSTQRKLPLIIKEHFGTSEFVF